MGYLIAAYGIIFAAILGYLIGLWLRERSSRQRLEVLMESRSKH